MTNSISCQIDSAKEMQIKAGQLAINLPKGLAIYLSGDLGAGKTTFSQGFLRELGVSDAIKSPTYSIIESYELDDSVVHHLDLYRLGSAEELEFLGLDSLMTNNATFLVEWPEIGRGVLPEADLLATITPTSDGMGRCIEWQCDDSRLFEIVKKVYAN